MNPYRQVTKENIISKRTFFGKLRRLKRSIILFIFGKSAKRLPAKCPFCGKLSEEPGGFIKRKYYGGFTIQLPKYRCGHRKYSV